MLCAYQTKQDFAFVGFGFPFASRQNAGSTVLNPSLVQLGLIRGQATHTNSRILPQHALVLGWLGLLDQTVRMWFSDSRNFQHGCRMSHAGLRPFGGVAVDDRHLATFCFHCTCHPEGPEVQVPLEGVHTLQHQYMVAPLKPQIWKLF